MDLPLADAELLDEDVCRVCRLEAEPDNPLYHPCRCSGTIRNVHSDCLIQWLGHSGKETCELCGYPFSFKKFYPDDMPSTLPPIKLIKSAFLDYLSLLLLVLRAIVVAFAWLVFLPLTAVFLWRNLFRAGGQAAFWLAGQESDPARRGQNATRAAKELVDVGKQVMVNLTNATFGGSMTGNETAGAVIEVAGVGRNGTEVVKGSLYELIRTHGFKAVGRAVSRVVYRQAFRPDMLEVILKGQIITAGMVVAFLSVFLLREWIFQAGPNPIEPEEVVVQDPPRAEEYKPEMAVKWRKARRRDKDGTQVLVGNGEVRLAGQLPPQRPIEAIAVGNPIPDQNVVQAPGLMGLREPRTVVAAGAIHGSSSSLAQAIPADDDSAWEDVTDENAASTAARSRNGEDESAEAQREALRQARNRYFEAPELTRELGMAGEGAFHPGPLATDIPREEPQNAEAGPSNPRRSPRLSAGPAGEHESDLPGGWPSPTEHDIREGHLTAEPLRVQVHVARGEAEQVRQPEPEKTPPAEIPILLDEVDEEEIEEGPDPLNEDEEDDDFPPGDEGGLIMEGDVEGILGAIGMQGPAIGILQNVLLINVVLASALVVLIHLPYIIGKTHLLADISIVLTLIQFPIRLIRMATDPVIDVLVDMFDVVILQSMGVTFKGGTGSMSSSGSVSLGDSSYVVRTIQAVSTPLHLLHRLSSDVTLAGGVPKALPYPLSLLEDQLAYLGSFSTWAWRSARTAINGWGASDAPAAKVVAIMLGYVDVLLVASAVVAYGERILGDNGKLLAETIGEHSDLLKLGVFMAIELVFFPLGMGYCLDLCTLPLFPDGTLQSRLEAHLKHKILSVFGHWLCGTHFMFAFAKFLSLCRSLCRRGAMYIIRDPSDPNFSPVKDILGKKSVTQLYKLCISAGMYLSVLGGPLGGILWLERHYSSRLSVLPLRWAYQSPLTQIPIDIILLLFVIPRHIRERHLDSVFKAYCRQIWNQTARALRLSSYMRGVRYPEQESPGKIERSVLQFAFNTTTRICQTLHISAPMEDEWNGGMMRVPYADLVVLVKPRKGVFVRVDGRGIPVSEEGKVVAMVQDRAARKGHRDPTQDYCMVYLPPFYRVRFWIFAVSIWVAVSFSIVQAVCLPVAVGRAVLSRILLQDEFHDGYSYVVGNYILHALLRIGWHAGRRAKSIVSRIATTPRYRDPWTPRKGLLHFSSEVMYRARAAYVLFTVYICLPAAIGVVLELYFLQPLKYGLSDMTPVIYPFEAWSYGLISMSLVYMRPNLRHRFIHLIGRHEIIGGFFRFALLPQHVNKQILLPIGGRLLALCVIPAVVSIALAWIVGMDERDSSLCFRFAYPLILSLAALWHAAPRIFAYGRAWSHAALEREYLVEKRVMNIEDAGSDDDVDGNGDDTVEASNARHGTRGDAGEAVADGTADDHWTDEDEVDAVPAAAPNGDATRTGNGSKVDTRPIATNIRDDPELAEDVRVLEQIREGADFAELMRFDTANSGDGGEEDEDEERGKRFDEYVGQGML